MNKWILVAGLSVMCVGCTQTMIMVHTQGEASDVVDETSAASPNVSPTITVPVSATGLPSVSSLIPSAVPAASK